MPNGLVATATLLATCWALGMAAWPARHYSTTTRKITLALIILAAAILPVFQPPAPIWLRILLVLSCPVMALKLIDLHFGVAYWKKKRWWHWFAYLVFPFILVPRVSIRSSRANGVDGAKKLIRALLQIAAGASILWLSFRIDWVRYPFLLEHTVKLLAIYLGAFDGLFLLVEGILLLIGINVLPLTLDPIIADTPADFWRRYNCEVSRFLREDIFRALGSLRHPMRGILAAFTISAILHEYLSWLLTSRIYGFQLAFFGLNGLAVAATYSWTPSGTNRIACRAITVLFIWATSIFFFENANKFLPWYAPR